MIEIAAIGSSNWTLLVASKLIDERSANRQRKHERN